MIGTIYRKWRQIIKRNPKTRIRKRGFFPLLSVTILAGCLVHSASAAQTSYSYVYTSKDESVPTALAYEPVRAVSGIDIGAGMLNKPQDMVVYQNETYVLDGENQRIVVLDRELKLQRIVTPKNADGSELLFQNALGIYVNGETLYIADRGAKMVYLLDGNGVLTNTIPSPDPAMLPPDFHYEPSKVLVSSKGYVYVVSVGSTAGALLFNPKLEFIGFFGSWDVAVTENLLLDNLWRKLLNPEQTLSALTRRLPEPMVNFVIDEEDYIYASRGTAGGRQQVRRLNAQGVNILYTPSGLWGMFSERETWFDEQNNVYVDSLLCDITVDKDGFITVLDSTRGRIFQYDTHSNNLFAFGGKASQLGNFQSPVAIDRLGDQLLVLDQQCGNITVFHPTKFADDVHAACVLYQDGKYVEAQPYWERVLKMDPNYELANIGMAKACSKLGMHEEALNYYRLGNDKEGYSAAAKLLRDDVLRRWFPVLLSVFLLLLAGLVFWLLYSEKHRKSDYAIRISRYQFPSYCLFHPFKGYTELKFERQGSLAIANGIIVSFFFVALINQQLTSFAFSTNDDVPFNILLELGKTVGLFAAWVICNWAISTFTDGEGKLREIWIFTAYALLPYILTLIVLTLTSRVFSLQERAFYDIFQNIGLLWFFISVFMSVKEVHQYTLKQTIFHLILTFIGIAFIVLIITVVYSMFVQLFGFVIMLGNELRMRS